MEENFPARRNKFAVNSIFWRRAIDWLAGHLPAPFHRPLIWTAACVFLLIATPARRGLLPNLKLIRPRSLRFANYARVLRVFVNFGWSLTDSAIYRMFHPRFRYELERSRYLDQLAAAKSAIVLTAHIGNYDLGAALFAERFDRRIKMVRAPESDALTAKHVRDTLEKSTGGAVAVGYSDRGTSLAFDLLSALRTGEIISIQGDRVVGDVGRAPVKFCGREILLPNGPFILSLVSETPIYPLFIVRTGHRKYKIVAREPILCARTNLSRDEAIASSMKRWADVLHEITSVYWPQWFAFVPLERSPSCSDA